MEDVESFQKPLTADELLSHATEFQFYPEESELGSPDIEYYKVTVSYRAPGLFAVLHMGNCWNGKKWEFELSPSTRTKQFKEKTWFLLDDAVDAAMKLVDKVSVNGRTWSELQDYLSLDSST